MGVTVVVTVVEVLVERVAAVGVVVTVEVGGVTVVQVLVE